ncbi:MAG: DUF3710 domain-containing protein [Propionibacteriaceae bacterium]|nr:DUF3710 domain-containing protein [Propionibacteriaceae bacterium]
MFGRKAREADSDAVEIDTDADLETEDGVDDTDAEEAEGATDVDPRADGPFDIDEVDLDADEVERVEFGPLVITPFEGLGLQLHGDKDSGVVQALLGTFGDSGLELALFAAPRTGGLAAELREAIIEETAQAGGHAQEAQGPFGTEVRRVLPMEGPEGEQLFHVSRIWLVEGPRWLLRGSLMGRAGLVGGEEAPADVFVEFFRNVVVKRDPQPRVPGELIHLALPAGAPRG